MTRRRSIRIPVLTGILAGFYLSPVEAAELACGGLALEVEADLERRFPDLADRVRSALTARDDTEECPKVELSAAGHEIQLRVALADGRSAQRTLARPEDVVPTLQALVIVPERSESGDSERSKSAAPVPSATTKRAAQPRPRRTSAKRRLQPRSDVAKDRGVLAESETPYTPSALRIELSASVGAHSGESGRSSLNFGLQSLLDIRRFLFGFQVRVDQYQGTAEGVSSAFELAALAGRRFDLDFLALDVFLGPSLAFPGDANSVDVRAAEGTRTSPPPPVQSDEEVVFAFLGARGSFFPDSTLRPFVAGDAALRLDERTAPDADIFPNWALGVSIGATVGTL